MLTGPVYAPMYVNNEWVRVNRTIGTFPKLVHVPTHFFKLVVGLKKQPGSSTKAIVPYTGSSSTSNGGSSAMVIYDAQAGACREWWPAEGTGQSIAVAAFLVPNSDTVDAKVSLFNGEGYCVIGWVLQRMSICIYLCELDNIICAASMEYNCLHVYIVLLLQTTLSSVSVRIEQLEAIGQ